MRQPPWTAEHTIPSRTHTRPRQTPGGDDGSSPGDEGDFIPGRSSGGQQPPNRQRSEAPRRRRQMDHLMEILEMMDLQVMEDILPDKDHQEEVDLWIYQEEDHLVPLAHLEILNPQEMRDLQAPLDHEDTEDLLDYKDL